MPEVSPSISVNADSGPRNEEAPDLAEASFPTDLK
jgi:hypothetical protein